MKKNYNLKKAVLLFFSVILITAFAGLLFPNELSVFTSKTEVVSEKVLVPGGQSVGVQMRVKGVLIVGLEEIETDRAIVNPGLDAGLQVGDSIVEINEIAVSSADEVRKIINQSKKAVDIKVNRKGRSVEVTVKPALDRTDNIYKIGIWVKEKIAGIGTLSFYDPEKNIYAALGHGIYETETGELLKVKDGSLLKTQVQSIKEGEVGKPGEIRGIFYHSDDPIGTLLENTEYGIYGRANPSINDLKLAEPVVMGTQGQIKKGPAYILTTIDGNNTEKFDIEIEKIHYQNTPDSKGLEIKVTDKELLDSCGGIVQGMSGSPIIQNNRIIGAITHVFINNPQKGYGIFIEWMVKEGSN
ncbi:MAG: SpoIVB peptidase [Eubacteriales bacterium]|nr:SpoIVB peptidase [Eubacteriales bacterium]